jgi:4-nitrophenyl phosphatase
MTLAHIKHLILDMDGVLWHGETPLPGFTPFFDTLNQQQIGFVLATNNASKTPAQYKAKLARFGVSVAEEQILTSAEATASYLSQSYAPGTAVFAVGGDGIQHALQTRGFHLLTIAEVQAGATAELVVVGFWRDVTFDHFAAGTVCINRGARFIGTNPDATFPSEYGRLPGAGSFISLIQTATGVTPTIIGKPGPAIFQEAMHRLGGQPENTAMVGDRLNTDIAGGKAAGIQTILVLSGISTQADVAQNPHLQPDFTFSDIGELAQQWQNS